MSHWSWLCGIGLLAVGSAARADVIHLDSGGSQECVVTKVTEQWVTFRTAMGVASLPRTKVVAITHDGEEVNQRFLKRWQAERAALAAQARARERKVQVERLQRQALGLVEYEGEWITPEERTARQEAAQRARAGAAAVSADEEAAGHHFHHALWLTPATYKAVRGAEQQLREHQDRLRELQNELALLSDEIEATRLMMLQEQGLEAMEARSQGLAKLLAQRDAATVELRDVRAGGDAIVERIETLLARGRERLRGLLAEQDFPPEAINYLVGPS